MRSTPVPITDDHIHIDPVNGLGSRRQGSSRNQGDLTSSLSANRLHPLASVPRSGKEFAPIFDATLGVADKVRELGLVVFPILGVHPAEMTRLAEVMPLPEVIEVMKGGLDLAAAYMREGKAMCAEERPPSLRGLSRSSCRGE